MSLRSVNPTDGSLVREYAEASTAEVASALSGAARAFEGWRRTAFAERASCLRRAASLLREGRADLARLMALEMGKPVAQGRAEAEKCAWACEHYAEHAERLLAPEEAPTDASRSYVAFEPLGPILAVMPWNFPLWQVFRFAAPALMAGNVGLLKHASNVSGCALAIEELLHAAGVPRDAFRTLLVGSPRVASLVEAPEVVAVTLTGSTPAGRAVAARAGACLKKTVLELGGSDPYVVLEDADLEKTAETCAAARLVNGGQSCIAAKRFVVVEPVLRRFEGLLAERMRARRVGDPLEEGVDVGPQARRDLRDELHRQVEASVARGARVLLGCEVPDGRGAFYPPSVLTGVGPGMAAFDEELFGPVAAIVAAKDEPDAIGLANHTAFGLGAAVFTRDLERGERIARHELAAGSCFVNAFVKSDPRLPFGGIRESGYGRELGAFGIREFVNVKTVYVA
ncbi:MAG TPA: NAD-dependent succinate-semialdehyde dehydrogenase [Vicinamibacteria bacterium]|nr:NAD-dependent succinate-semialdehyde dehydrogenase [Vicinamibacteria bacterium]